MDKAAERERLHQLLVQVQGCEDEITCAVLFTLLNQELLAQVAAGASINSSVFLNDLWYTWGLCSEYAQLPSSEAYQWIMEELERCISTEIVRLHDPLSPEQLQQLKTPGWHFFRRRNKQST